LLTQAPGDNGQCLALAEALDHPTEFRRLDWSVVDVAEDSAILRELLADTPEAEAWRNALDLCAPWPDLVICCGRRADKVAFWIKRQSGGRTKIVSIGRARLSVALYDLLIAPPEFALPERANVVHIPLPMARRQHKRDTAVNRANVPVPKPWFTILLGGEVKQFAASERVLVEAARRAQMAATKHGGTVVISTSRRTPRTLLAAVERVLDRPYIYRWSATGTAENPYETLLLESAALFVTADSVSMVLDGCGSGTPTYVIEYPDRLDLAARVRRDVFRYMRRIITQLRNWGFAKASETLDQVQEWLHARKILRYPRDLRRFHASVYKMGLAHPASAFDPAVLPEPRRPGADLTEVSGIRAVAERCLALVREPATAQ
jgi:uncharacterized protein